MKDLIPLVTPIVAIILFVIGIMLWRVQLVSKRKFEVAEQCMIAFVKAADALAKLRAPVLYKGMWHWPKFPPSPDWFPADEAEQYRNSLDTLYRERLAVSEPAFSELRVAQILAEVHFGPKAGNAFESLVVGRAGAERAVEMLFTTIPELLNSPKAGELMNEDNIVSRNASALTPKPELVSTIDPNPRTIDTSADAIAKDREQLFAFVRPALINADLNAAKPWVEKFLNIMISSSTLNIQASKEAAGLITYMLEKVRKR